jgi:hypothetical protein
MVKPSLTVGLPSRYAVAVGGSSPTVKEGSLTDGKALPHGPATVPLRRCFEPRSNLGSSAKQQIHDNLCNLWLSNR